MSDKTTMLIRIGYVVIFRAIYNLALCWAAGLIAYAVTQLLGGG